MASKLIHDLKSGAYGNPLEQFHKDAMLDLVLAWGSLDGALTMLISAFTGEELHITADRLAKGKAATKLSEIIKLLEKDERTSKFAINFKKYKKQYEKHSKPRNRIAHAHCVGYLLSNDKYIVFAVPEPEHRGGKLMAIEAIPVEGMKAATKFGQSLTEFSTQTAEKICAARRQ